MKKLLGLVLLIISINCLGQPGYQSRTVREKVIAFAVDSGLHIPRYCGTPSNVRSGVYVADGALAMDTCNNRFYIYSGGAWIRLASYDELSSAGDTSVLSTRAWRQKGDDSLGALISLKLNKSDTSVANSGSVATNKRLQKIADSLAALGGSTADGFSVLGRSGSSSGPAASITASNNEAVLFKNANVLQFGQPNLIKNQGNPIGDIFEKSTMADTTGVTAYSDGHTTYSFNSNRLRVQTTSGGSTLRDSRVIVDTFMKIGLDKITIEVDVQYNTIGSQNYGFYLGLYNFDAQRYSCSGFMYSATAGNPIGTILLASGDNNLSILRATSSTQLSFSTGDIVTQRFEAFENTVWFSVRNKTTNSAWITVSYTFKDLETKYSAGYPTIGINGFDADYYIRSIKVSSKAIKNPDVYLFGDSKFTKSTYQNESFYSLLKNNFGVVESNSNPGGASSDAVDELYYIINYVKPKKVVYSNSNDERYGIGNSTWQAQYDTIYNRLTRNGIEVYFTSFYETSTSQADVNTFLSGSYSSVYIQRPYTVLSNLNTSDYLNGDGIHLTANGNKIAYEETILDGKLNGNRYWALKDVGSIVPNFNQSGYGTVYVRSDSLRAYVNGVEYTLGRSTSKPALNKGAFIETPSSSEAIDVWQTPVAITITSLKAILRGSSSPSVTYNIKFGTDITSATTVFTSDITCTSVTTGCSNSSGFNDATIPAGSFIWIVTTAQSGTVNSIAFTINYTED